MRARNFPWITVGSKSTASPAPIRSRVSAKAASGSSQPPTSTPPGKRSFAVVSTR